MKSSDHIPVAGVHPVHGSILIRLVSRRSALRAALSRSYACPVRCTGARTGSACVSLVEDLRQQVKLSTGDDESQPYQNLGVRSP